MPLLFLALESPSTALGGHPGPDLTRYVTVCALLLLMVAALGWGFRRLLGRTMQARAAQRSLRIMDLLPMGGKQKLAVVRCYDRTFLLGLGEREVSLVAELDPVIAPASEALPRDADRRSFGDLLARLRKSEPRKEVAPAPRGATPAKTPAPLPDQGVLG